MSFIPRHSAALVVDLSSGGSLALFGGADLVGELVPGVGSSDLILTPASGQPELVLDVGSSADLHLGRALDLDQVEAIAPFYQGPKGDPGVGGGGAVLPAPDLLDEADPIHFFFGWGDVSGGWLIERQVRATAAAGRADQTGNPGLVDLAAAWAVRASLTYS